MRTGQGRHRRRVSGAVLTRWIVAGVVAGTIVMSAGCGGSSGTVADTGAAGSDDAPTALSVVSSTTVWADIAAGIGGDAVDATAIIDDPSQDPHDYQPSGRDELAISRADLVIVNGGGYDDPIRAMATGVGDGPLVLDATDIAERAGLVRDDNEHIWFSLDAVEAVAAEIGRALQRLEPDLATTVAAGLADLHDALAPVRDRMATVREEFAGTPVAITEPLPLYLVEDLGLDNRTPAAFSEALEEGIDVAPVLLGEVLAMLSERQVAVLIYNEQSITGQTEQVLAAAREHRVPVVTVTELLPAGSHYPAWIGGAVDRIHAALIEGGRR